MEVTLELPFPPSVNTYWRSFKGRVLLSENGRKYKVSVFEAVLLAGRKRFAGNIKVEIAANQPDNRRRDLDNYLKAPLDALMAAGMYEDDSQIVDLRIYWTQEKGKTIKITLRDA